MRKLLTLVMITTVAATVAWTTITFFGDSTMLYTDPETNVTAPVEIPRLQIKAYYPWNPVGSKMSYFLTIGFQFYYLLFSMVHSNSSDVLFCSWVLFACEQLQHLKVNQLFFILELFYPLFLLPFLSCAFTRHENFNLLCQLKTFFNFSHSGCHATIDGAVSNTGYLSPELCCALPQHIGRVEGGIDS